MSAVQKSQAERWDAAALPGPLAAALADLWVDRLRYAFAYAYGERLNGLHGRRVRSFDSRGIHPFSHAWGQVQQVEELLGDVLPAEFRLSPVELRYEAEKDAEQEFAREVAEHGSAVFEQADRQNRS